MTPAHTYLELLGKEREAAIAADLEALVEIQDDKRRAMTALHEEETPSELLSQLADRASENITLIRHFVTCLRGVASLGQGETYTAAGHRADGRFGASRGAL